MITDSDVYKCPNDHGVDVTGVNSICPECNAALVKATARELVERANRLHEEALVAKAAYDHWWDLERAAQKRLTAANAALLDAFNWRCTGRRTLTSDRHLEDAQVVWAKAQKEFNALFDEKGGIRGVSDCEAKTRWWDAHKQAVTALCREAGLKRTVD